ncbi:MAG: hypothetical protein ABI846_01095 [Rudaea sp.]
MSFSGQRAPHVAGFPIAAVDAIGIAPTRSVAGMALYEDVQVIAPQIGAAIVGLWRMEVARRPPDERMPARLHSRSTSVATTLSR